MSDMTMHHHPSMKFPYLAVFFDQDNGNGVIKVYETEHLNVFKTLCLGNIWDISENKSFIGLGNPHNQPPQFHLIGKKDLFNREFPPEKTFQRQITIEGDNSEGITFTDLNTTSIVVLQKEEQSEDLCLLKRNDFWI